MAIEKPMTPFEFGPEDEPEIEVAIATDEEPSIEIDADTGEVTIDFGDEDDDDESEDMTAHDANLAESIDDGDLESLASDLIESFLSDRESRKEWATAYITGLDLLGMKIEDRTQPWAGASGVYHPMLTESVVRFQAQAMSELMPASGPVRTKIMGKLTPEKADQANPSRPR